MLDQDLAISSLEEETKEPTQALYSVFQCDFETPKTPKTPLASGRFHNNHGASPSPALLNPISDEDWNESTSRLSISCPKLSSPKSSELVLRRLRSGYHLVSLFFCFHVFEVQKRY